MIVIVFVCCVVVVVIVVVGSRVPNPKAGKVFFTPFCNSASWFSVT